MWSRRKPAIAGAGLTQVGFILGTPMYMSPEQGEGCPLDFRSDRYSLGVLLFEMLTGEPPCRADSAVGMIYQHCHSPVPTLPPELAAYQPLITRLIAKAPDQRFQRARELLDEGD